MGRNRPLALRSKSLERQQGNVIFLLPLFSSELLQLGQQRIDQRRGAWVCTNKSLHSWGTKHLTPRVVSLDQPIAVEEHAIARREGPLLLLVAHARHETQGYSPRPEFARYAFVPAAREVVPSVGVSHPALRWVEDSVEAGDEHVGRKVCTEDFVGLLQHLTRGETCSLGDGAKHALGAGHYQSRRYPFAGGVTYDEAHTAVVQVQEVVEVAAYLSCRPVVVGYPPPLELG